MPGLILLRRIRSTALRGVAAAAPVLTGCAHSNPIELGAEVAALAGLAVVQATQDFRDDLGLEHVRAYSLSGDVMGGREYSKAIDSRLLRMDSSICYARTGHPRSCPESQPPERRMTIIVYPPVWLSGRDAAVKVGAFAPDRNSFFVVGVSRSETGDWRPVRLACEQFSPCEIPPRGLPLNRGSRGGELSSSRTP